MIIRLNASEWATVSENFHRAVFSKEKPATWDRIDYAWLVIDDRTDSPIGYITVRELDHETVYWQFGGSFEWARSSVVTVRAYDACLLNQAKLSKRVTTAISAKNPRMLKLALSRGWEIFGSRNWDGETMVELKKEFGNGNDSELRSDAESEVGLEKTDA